jgi:hypothetical protein
MHTPMTPLQMIIKAANRVSRAKVATPGPPAIINEMMRDASMTVTTMARISVP